MDFDDTREEAAFRAEVRAWLAANARPRSDDADFSRHYHTAVVDDGAEAAHVLRCKRWQATLYAGGWAGITWPKEYGGRGASPMESMIFNQEQAAFDVSAGVFSVGIG
ncbi:MAG TPA: acyl-CoA dehydrogenase family protein, partial [Acidimicrobiia bacterium]|nr:acyl-CoA dehydrogenase family protein [Acidimicrobiia bacterium]